MIDAVLSYHLNPNTCGVARFNQQLAARLGVPCLPLGSECQYPLVSVKIAELEAGVQVLHPGHVLRRPFDLFLHDRSPRINGLAGHARRVFYADELGCPSTVQGNPHRGAYRVLTFGMAHKLVLPHFEELKVHLEAYEPDYTISLSTAVHEGSPWDTALTESAEAMRAIFGDKLRVLGFLADDALAKELQDSDAVAAFFTPALRANNTSYWAAVEAGKPVYTNRDEHSPGPDARVTWDGLIEALRA